MKAYFDKEKDCMVFDLEHEKITIPERPGATYGIFRNHPTVIRGHFIFEGVVNVPNTTKVVEEEKS